MRSRRIAFLVAALAALLIIPVSGASASGAVISPASQSRNSGVAAVWGGAWGSSGPYEVTFDYGDGSTPWHTSSTTATSMGYSHAFYTCTSRQYTQTLDARELSSPYGDAVSHASTTVHFGACFR